MIGVRHVACLAVCAVTACAQEPEAPSVEEVARLDREATALLASLEALPATDALVVRLAFGSEADLDLYVTDPLLESVYFANRTARSGGRLIQDVRCDVKVVPRIEEARYEAPLRGAYRIGVDHPARCDQAATPVAWAVRADGPGVNASAHGSIAPGTFEVIVLEFEVGGSS